MTSKGGLISVTPPVVPIWGVFYVEGEPGDNLVFCPVVTLALVEEEMGDPSSRVIRPLCFDRDLYLCWGGEDDYILGYVLEEEIPEAAKIFADSIARERNKKSATA